MFHLLVSSAGWPNAGGSIGNGRIYLNEQTHPGNMFYQNGVLDTSKVSQFPALLVTEPGGRGEQVAKVAHITNVIPGHKETTIHYTIDNGISPISNAVLEKYPNELSLGTFGLAHTHWKVIQLDLYKFLLNIQQNNTIKPSVFSLEKVYTPEENLVSVMMPFRQEFNQVYTTLQNSCAEIGLQCVRADDIWEENAIIQDVVNLIGRAKIVICDCSGKNPNVFYETGIAHAVGKEVILITQSQDDIPFDLRHLRYIHYLGNSEGCQVLGEAVQNRINHIRTTNA